MKARRFNPQDDPFVETNIESAKLYAADLEYIQSRGLALRSILRDALRSYVQALQENHPAPQTTTSRTNMKPAVLPGNRAFKIRIRPDIATRIVPSFPWLPYNIWLSNRDARDIEPVIG